MKAIKAITLSLFMVGVVSTKPCIIDEDCPNGEYCDFIIGRCSVDSDWNCPYGTHDDTNKRSCEYYGTHARPFAHTKDCMSDSDCPKGTICG
ncbi:hypothetical protein BG006_008482, partial [Podila minutissima]